MNVPKMLAVGGCQWGLLLAVAPSQDDATLDIRNPLPGLALRSTFTGDYSSVWRTGTPRDSVSRSLLGLEAYLDLQQAFGAGGQFFGHGEMFAGRNGSESVGDIQAISNIDGENGAQLDELWYQQSFGGLRVKVGLVDSNAEFAYLPAASSFLNQSAAFSPTIFGLPSYPAPALSLNVSYAHDSGLYASAGLYDGAGLLGAHTGLRGVSRFFDGDSAGHCLIAEGGHQSPHGKFGGGGWHHSAAMQAQEGSRHDTTGGYAFANYLLVGRPDDAGEGEGLRGIARYGWAAGDFVPVEQHALLGLTYTGTFPGRDRDTLGAMVSRVVLVEAPAGSSSIGRSAETVFELFYCAEINPVLSLTADVQYVDDPSGDRSLGDALVATLRVDLAF